MYTSGEKCGVVESRGTCPLPYVIAAYAIVDTLLSHSPAESNYARADSTGGVTAMCVCEREKTVRTTDNEGF